MTQLDSKPLSSPQEMKTALPFMPCRMADPVPLGNDVNHNPVSVDSSGSSTSSKSLARGLAMVDISIFFQPLKLVSS